MIRHMEMQATKRNTPRSFLAVLVGLLIAALLSIGTDAVLHATQVFPPVGQNMDNGLWVLAAAYRFVFQMLGGYATARLAPVKPMGHVRILAGIGLVLGVLGLLAWRGMGPAGGPLWYPIALVATAIPSVWLGGLFFMRQRVN